jgi:hypothetical protein
MKINADYNFFFNLNRIWNEWEIIDYKFKYMIMRNGDDCGQHGKNE